MAVEFGLIVEILRLDETSPAAWHDITADVQSVGTAGQGMAFPQSPSPSEGRCNITLNNYSGDYDAGLPLIRQGNPIRVRAKSGLGKCLRVTHTGNTDPCYVANVVYVGIGAGTHITATWEARSAFDSKWNTDTPYIQVGGSQYFHADTDITYTNQWASYSIDIPSSVSGAIVAPVFAPSRTATLKYQYTEYRNIVITVGGTPITYAPDDAGWYVAPTGSGTYAIEAVSDAYGLFYGFIESAQRSPRYLVGGTKTTSLQCIDFVARLNRAKMNAPLQRRKTADQLVQTALDYVASNPSASWRAWARECGARRYYPLNEAAGATVAVDYGVDGLNSSAVAATTFGATGLLSNGDPATSATFNGSTSKITLPSLDLSNRSFTVQAEIKLLSIPDPQPVIVLYDEDLDRYFELRVELNSSGDLVWDSISHQTTASNAVSFNVAHLITAVYDYPARTITVYVDGASVATGTSILQIEGSIANPFVGYSNNSNYAASGYIQNVQIWDSPLSAADVAAAYAATQFSETKQRRWFPGIEIATCSQEFSVAFDQYQSNRVSVFAAIEDTINSEGGRWYVEGDGTLRIRNRDWWLLWRNRVTGAVQAADYTTLLLADGDQYDVMADEGGDRVINRVFMTYKPRTISTGSAVVLGSGTGVIPPIVSGKYGDVGAIAGEETITIFFKNDAGNPWAGYDFVLPLVSYHDWGNITPPAEGTYDLRVSDNLADDATDYTPGYPANPLSKYCEYQIVSLSPSEAKIRFRNWATGKLYVRVLQIRGKSITSFDTVRIEERDQAAIDDSDDERAYTVPLPFVSDMAFARAYAQYYKKVYATPFEQFSVFSFENKRVIGSVDLFSLKIGDVIGVDGLENNYYHLITGIDRQLMPGDSIMINVRTARADTALWRSVDDGAFTVDGGGLVGI